MDRAFLVQPSLAELAERGIRHAVTGPPLGTHGCAFSTTKDALRYKERRVGEVLGRHTSLTCYPVSSSASVKLR